MLRAALLLSLSLLPAPALAWDIFTEKSEDGGVFTVAEQTGDAGLFLQLVCYQKRFHIEIIIPEGFDAKSDGAELLQVDHHPERLLAGFYDKIDNNTTAFIGIDRRDKPAKATEDLIARMKRGQFLYLGDPDRNEAIEVWSMRGVSKALRDAEKRCI